MKEELPSNHDPFFKKKKKSCAQDISIFLIQNKIFSGTMGTNFSLALSFVFYGVYSSKETLREDPTTLENCTQYFYIWYVFL